MRKVKRKSVESKKGERAKDWKKKGQKETTNKAEPTPHLIQVPAVLATNHTQSQPSS